MVLIQSVTHRKSDDTLVFHVPGPVHMGTGVISVLTLKAMADRAFGQIMIYEWLSRLRGT